MVHIGAAVQMSGFHSNDPRLFLRKVECKLLFNVDIASFLLKTKGMRTKASFCYFCSLESFNC